MVEIKRDWHRAEIVCALKIKGHSVRALSIESGLAPDSLKETLRKKWPKGEKIIADALGVNPRDIWPSRYEG